MEIMSKMKMLGGIQELTEEILKYEGETVRMYSSLHLHKIMEGLYLYLLQFICLCVCLSVHLWTKCRSNGCINLDCDFAKRLLTALARTLFLDNFSVLDLVIRSTSHVKGHRRGGVCVLWMLLVLNSNFLKGTGFTFRKIKHWNCMDKKVWTINGMTSFS